MLAGTLLLLLGLLLTLVTAAASPQQRALRQSNPRDGPMDCACPQAAAFMGQCPSSQATLVLQGASSTYVACSPAPEYDMYSRTLFWSACLRVACFPTAFGTSNFSVSVSGARLLGADTLTGPTTLGVRVVTSAGITLTQTSLQTGAGQQLAVVGSAGQAQGTLSIPAEGVVSLSATVRVTPDARNSTSIVSLQLVDAALAGQPPAQPLPPLSPPSLLPPDNNAGVVTGVVSTAYLVGYPLSPGAVPAFLDDNTTVSINGTYINVVAGYADFTVVGTCSATTSAAASQVLEDAGWQVAGVSCVLNTPNAASSIPCGASMLLLSVTVALDAAIDMTVQQQGLRTVLSASPSGGQGLGANCTTTPHVSSLVAVQEAVDPSQVANSASQSGACVASQGRVQAQLAASLSLTSHQLLYLPTFCSAYIHYPAPSAPYPPPDAPDAPELIRRPYAVWKSAVLGGILGGVFLVQIVVLAVWVWYNRQEHRRAEAALALAYQAPHHKYGAVETTMLAP